VWKLNLYVGLQLAAFVDLGIAWTESRQFAANNFITGYGGGVRLRVPWVNVIRFDLAAGQPGNGLRFEFGIGPKEVAQRLAAR
jgi:outer membrane translocation and assembly module TamA